MSRAKDNRLTLTLTLLTTCTLAPAAAFGQSRDLPARWEVSVHMGFGKGTDSPSGSGQLPAPGQTFAMPNGQQSHYVPSWFFGDGAAMMNAHNVSRSIAGRINPLDPILTARSTMFRAVAQLGATVTFHATPTWAVEGRVEIAPYAMEFTDAAIAQMVNSASSFATALNGVMAFWSFNDYSSATSVSTAPGTVIVFSGGVRRRLGNTSRFQPFLFVGAGWSRSTEATALIAGDYEFLSTAARPFHETDVVRIRSRAKPAGFGRVAVGVTEDIWWRLGFRGEVSATIGRQALQTLIGTTPSRETAIMPGTISSTASGNNGILFSTIDSLSSSLSDQLTDFETFSANGWRIHVSVTIGAFVRF